MDREGVAGDWPQGLGTGRIVAVLILMYLCVAFATPMVRPPVSPLGLSLLAGALLSPIVLRWRPRWFWPVMLGSTGLLSLAVAVYVQSGGGWRGSESSFVLVAGLLGQGLGSLFATRPIPLLDRPVRGWRAILATLFALLPAAVVLLASDRPGSAPRTSTPTEIHVAVALCALVVMFVVTRALWRRTVAAVAADAEMGS